MELEPLGSEAVVQHHSEGNEAQGEVRATQALGGGRSPEGVCTLARKTEGKSGISDLLDYKEESG